MKAKKQCGNLTIGVFSSSTLQSRVSCERIQWMSEFYNAFAIRRLLKGAFRRRQRTNEPHRRIVVRIVVGTEYVNIAHTIRTSISA